MARDSPETGRGSGPLRWRLTRLLEMWKGRRRRWVAGLVFLSPLTFLLALAWYRSGLESPEPTYLLRDRHGSFLGEAS
ncbi:MAG: hypothetical protein MPN21_11130, partial [Thermoanaerobaculia bacterium]|nr:hypothetical protein [Thermoanaerobaculia bacterium]